MPQHDDAETLSGSVRLLRRARRTTLTIKVADAPDWITLTGAAQVTQVRRTVITGSTKSVKVVGLITSTNHAIALAVLARVGPKPRGASRTGCTGSVTSPTTRTAPSVRTGNASRVIATVRNTAISLMRLAG